jgi:malonate decarboxylase beta subunit
LDASDRTLVWGLIGGEQRTATGLADELLEDDSVAIAAAIRAAFSRGLPQPERSSHVELYRQRLAAIDPQQLLDGKTLREKWRKEPAT